VTDPFWEFERAGWERAAEHYDICWTDTLLFVEALLDAAAVGPGTRVLDVACGPGYVAAGALERRAQPVGLDFAPAMVRIAAARVPGGEFVEGDAQHLPFSDESFDAVTMGFGVHHLSEPERAFAEARRVLGPGRRYAFTSWAEEGNDADAIVGAAIEAHADPDVDVPAGPPFFAFSNHEAAAAALTRGGFDPESFRFETVRAIWRLADPDALFQAELDAGVRTGAVLRGQSEERLARIREAIAAGVSAHDDGDGYPLTLAAHVVSAATPS